MEPANITERILQAVASSPDCLLDELVCRCSDLTWNQVLLEVDRLSRSGEILLRWNKAGRYTISLALSGQQLKETAHHAAR